MNIIRRAGRQHHFETLEPRHLLTGSPFISEFVASNNAGLKDKDGAFSDWLEITNPAGDPVNLNGWYLTDDAANLTKWQIPNVSVPAGGTLVVFASNKNLTDPAGELHTNFALSAGGEFLGLIRPDHSIASQFAPTFPAQTANVSYGYLPDDDILAGSGDAVRTFVPSGSLGTTWTSIGFNDASWSTGVAGVGFGSNYSGLVSKNVQSAMQNVNSSIYVRMPFQVDDLGAIDALRLKMQYDDGFVVYLNGVSVASVNAGGTVTWNSTATSAVTGAAPASTEIDLSNYIDLLVTGENVLAIQGLNIAAADGDFLIAPELVAYNLDSGAPTFMQVPTPGALNLPSSVNQVSEVQFSQARGFYDSAFNLVLTSATAGATIYYTTDGSPPSPTSGIAYTTPISISTTTVVRAMAVKAGLFATKVATNTYLFLEDVIHQPENIAGWPNPVKDVGNGNSAQHDYEMDPAIVNNPAYSQALLDGLTSIPTLAISVDFDTMWGPTGFYEGDAEVPMSVEIIDPNDPSQTVQADGGIEGHSHDRLKRSLRISFKSQYGPNKLLSDLLQNAPLNGDSASNRLDNIVLRAGNNRAWSRDFNADATTFTEDEWYRDTQIAMTGYGSHGTFVHLYINGIYWGLYNPAERPDEDFSARYFGGSDDDYWSINHDNRTSGDSTQWDYLTDTLINEDTTNPAVYQEIQNYLDVSGFSDYLLLNWYQATTDWPGNNWFAGNNNVEQGPVRFYAWDGEWSWDVSNQYNVDGAWVHPSFRTDGSGSAPTVEIWHALRQNDDFMTLFADRAFKSLFNDGALTDAKSLARWDTLNDYIHDAVVAESARWGDSLAGLGQPTRTRDVDWQNEVDKIANIMVGNGAQLVAAMRAQGYYPSIDPATFSLRGGTVPTGYHVQLSAPVGTIYYTLDGSDPRLAGGGISPNAIAYSGGGIAINSNLTIKLRVLSAGEWSAIDEATFQAVLGGNVPPVVNAGNDLTVPLGGQANLAGLVTDDGKPSGTLTTSWSVAAGPGTVTFGNAAQPSTTATFSANGVYVLRLTGNDGEFSVTDDVSVTVSNPAAPTILALALINADTDLPIPGYESLQPGAVLNLATLPTTHLNVSAIVSNSVSSVKFGLDTNANFRTERSAPFSLFGDTTGNFAAGSFTVGSHTLTATPSSGTSSGAALSVAFSVINQPVVTNQAPTVSAGIDQSITLPNVVNLSGTATDDNLPSGTLTTTWTQFSGPGTVTFGNAAQLATTASFSAAGTYVLRLTASDGELSSFDDISVTVAAPAGLTVSSLTLINADNEQPIAGYEAIQPGAVINLALLPTTNLNVRANTSSGVKNVKFGLDANASFRSEGTAPFALFGDANGNYYAGSFSLGSHTIAATPFSTTTGTGTPGPTLSVSFSVINQPVVTNHAPIVSAGTTQNVVLPNSANLAGSVTDDNLPGGPLTIAWTKISGPGTVTFGNAAQPSTTASFSAAGTYVLQLSANDGEFTSTSNVTINVTTVPLGPAVTSLTLINADTDQPVPGYENLANGAVIDLSTLTTGNLNIRANTSGTFGSVKFGLDGNANFRNESSAPFALFGDSNGDYHGVQIPAGLHIVTAKTYSNSNGTGTAGGGVTISFTITGTPQQMAAASAVDGGGVGSDPTAYYRLWRETFGSTTDLRADANNDGEVSLPDYVTWRHYMGSLGFSMIVPVYEEVAAAPAAGASVEPESQELAGPQLQAVFSSFSRPEPESRPLVTAVGTALTDPSSTDAALLLLSNDSGPRKTAEGESTPLVADEPKQDETLSGLDDAFGAW